MFAIVDIETTGGYSQAHKITEIGIVIHDGEKVVDTWQSLINPEKHISPQITMLTGITNEMVKNAPKFYEVAKEIFLLTQDKIFVAHNVNFDYSFIREEFKSLGGEFNRKRLCTVRLARKFIPGHSSYSLGNICKSLGIEIRNRHRALGDAEATAELFSLILKNDPDSSILKMGKKMFSEGNLPAHVNAEVYRELPAETGVYYFHDEHGKIIYVGKAVDIKKRIQQHFTGPKGSRLNFLDKIYNITYKLTGTELIALLFESHEIKHLWPQYNQAQKTSKGSYILTEYVDGRGIHRLALAQKNKQLQSISTFRNLEEGRAFLYRLCEEHQLCPKCCNLQTSVRECFDYKLKKCRGVCCEMEEVEVYNQRVAQALQSYKGHQETHIIIGKGRNEDEKSVVLVEKGEYKGFGFVPLHQVLETTADVLQVIEPYQDNADIRKILGWYFNSVKQEV